MNILFKPSFVKDFNKLPAKKKEDVRKICTEDFLAAKDLTEFKYADVSSIKGFKGYYRIRTGDYRIGFKKEGQFIIFMRVRHRKDIYKFFP